MIRDDDQSELTDFDRARAHLRLAQEAEGSLIDCWNELRSMKPFRSRVVVDGPFCGRLEVEVHWPEAIRQAADEATARFVRAIAQAFDGAIQAAVGVAVGQPASASAETKMPLCEDEDAFLAEAARPTFRRLRADQLDLVRLFQPFENGPRGPGVMVHHRIAMNHLHALITASPPVAVWAHAAAPLFRAVDGSPVEVACIPTEPGVVAPSRTIATFNCADTPISAVSANPNVEFSPIFDVRPYPTNPNDTLGDRIAAILDTASEFIDAMERSSQPAALLPGFKWLAQQLERRDRSPWGKVDLKRSPVGRHLRRALRRSDIGVATYAEPDGERTVFVRSNGETYARPLPQATPPPIGMLPGPGAEHASLLVAGEWGLQDFVMRPQLVRKGEGSREVGDGTVVVGNRALAIQVKSRGAVTDSPDRERRWALKQIRIGASQASGTVRLLRGSPMTLENLRGRRVSVEGSRLDWLRVVIIDHPNPVRLRYPHEQVASVPLAVICRRDWDFLLDQLRSLSAVVDYLFRVSAEDSTVVGDEATRYFELARYDQEASSGKAAPWLSRFGSPKVLSSPTLPMAPASRIDAAGHLVYRILLEDIAESEWSSDEGDRLHLLALLDRYPVADRADLGRVLLDRLDDVMSSTEGVKWQFRRVLLDEGRLQLAFGAASRLDQHTQEAFRQWAMLRHHEFAEVQPVEGRDARRTVAVLMTPRFDGTRYWDTTTVALLGDLQLEPDEVNRFRHLWGNATAA